MIVLLPFALVFAIGFLAGVLLTATAVILTDREEPASGPGSRIFPSYQRYLMQKKDGHAPDGAKEKI